jgi:hypothetical protein
MKQYLDMSSGIGGIAQDNEPKLSKQTGGSRSSESGTSKNDEDPEVLVEYIAESVEEQTTRLRVEGMIKDAMDSTKRNATYYQTLINDLNSNKHNDIVGGMVKQIGG